MPQRILAALLAALASAVMPLPVSAQGNATLAETVRQVSRHIGEMSMTLETSDVGVTETLRFEPFQQLEEMFLRDDVVYLMRHGPTDWSKLDRKNVAPTDCANQRVLSADGARKMRELGALLASNEILPSRIVASQWCRNQQTVDHLFKGFDMVDPTIADNIPVETDGALNLLLSLQGAKTVTGLRQRISDWDGDPDRKGPLLIVTHYTNIEELTQFRVFEGEILVLDPKRNNQVLGYVRLRSSEPDVGHFAESLSSPLLKESEALDMILRYYEALGAGDRDQLAQILSDRWVGHGTSALGDVQDLDSFLASVQSIAGGLSEAKFDVGDIYVTEEVVTVIGTISGLHSGSIYGIPASFKPVEFGGIAVHRMENGKIAETWQMADRLSLLRQITD